MRPRIDYFAASFLLTVVLGKLEDKKIVCYFSSWSTERFGKAKFNIEDIDPFACTHIIYAFADLREDYGLSPKSNKIDIEQGGYKKITDLKKVNLDLKVLIGTGGTRNGPTTFSMMASDAEQRAIIVNSAMEFLRNFNFDGLDLDWQFPGFPNEGMMSDKEAYVALATELRTAFEDEAKKSGKERLLLTMVVPQVASYIQRGYDLSALTKVVDMMNLLGYDFHLPQETTLEHHAPLYAAPDDETNAENNLDFIVRLYLKLGVEPEKIIMGIPAYGSTFTLANLNETCLGCENNGEGLGDDEFSHRGIMSYRDICYKIANEDGWTVKRPYPDAMGPYAYRASHWVSYDDEEAIRLKVNYVKYMKLGGIMFWSLDLMDVKGICNKGKFPLIKAAREELSKKIVDPNSIGTRVPRLTKSTVTMNNTDQNSIHQLEMQEQSDNSTKIVCYLQSWSLENTGSKRFYIENIDPHYCTHIVYAYAEVTDDMELQPRDQNIDIDKGGYQKITELKMFNPKLKVLIGAVGANTNPDTFSVIVSDPAKRATLIKNAIKFLRQYNFDGLDFEWQYPGSPLGNQETDKDSYFKLVREFKYAFVKEANETKQERLLITMVVPQVSSYVTMGYDIPSLNTFIDFMNLLAFDFHPVEVTTLEHHAPLYAQPNDLTDSERNVDFIVQLYLKQGLDPHKLVVGIPAHGSSVILAKIKGACLGCKVSDGGVPLERGSQSYREICSRLQTDKDWTVERPYPFEMGPYAFKDKIWMSYDDEESVKLKANYVKKMNLGGVMFWSLDEMDTEGVCNKGGFGLIRAARQVLKYREPRHDTEQVVMILPKPVTTTEAPTSPSTLPVKKTTQPAVPKPTKIVFPHIRKPVRLIDYENLNGEGPLNKKKNKPNLNVYVAKRDMIFQNLNVSVTNNYYKKDSNN